MKPSETLDSELTAGMAKLQGTRLGAFRAYFFGFFICTAGFLFGYDTGIVGMSGLTPSSTVFQPEL